MKTVWDAYRNNRINFYLGCIFVLTIGMLVSSQTSLAYFTAHDEVMNQHHAAELEIRLFEPEWDAGGMEKAKQLQPGMTIEKDPYVYNASDADVYVRMQIEMLELNADGTVKYTDGKENYITGDRYDSIMNAIYYRDAQDKTERLAAYDEAAGYISNNPAFCYDDGWFYYAAPQADGYLLTALAPESSTEKLFDELHIPVLKSEYLGVFDANFSVRVTAQAVPAGAVSADADTEAVKALFEAQYGS